MSELRIESLVLPAAALGPENPLPAFRGHADDLTVGCDERITAAERERLGWRCAWRVLPYRMQDDYGRARRPHRFRVVVLENQHLRAIIAPELGGRLLSLLDRHSGRELLARNPVFQPANLALRNAWFSGGIEFNAGQFGHHHLTCAPVFAARVRGPDGSPALRIYEWERSKCFPWQVEFHLPADSRFLFIHVRLVNPHDHELAMYWWSNIAVPEREGTRVIMPATSALHSVGTNRFGAVAVPADERGLDHTYPRHLPTAHEYFYRIAEDSRPWVAAVDADGSGLVQVSTARLLGRKAFYWGTNQGGRNWQDFLSPGGEPYFEIQAGLARTQIEHVPMPAGAHWSWTEAYGALAVDARRAHARDWAQARGCVSEQLAAQLPEDRFAALDRGFAEVADAPAEELLQLGSGWGALERRRLAVSGLPDRIPAALDFSAPGAEQQPWLELLEHGSLPEAGAPGALMVQTEWRRLLEQALTSAKGDHWLAWWHLGVMRLEDRDLAGARVAWTTSLARRRTSWALRNLAVLAAREALPEAMLRAHPGNEPPARAAAELLLEAWQAGPHSAALAAECAQQLHGTGQHSRLLDFVAGLPAAIRDHERLAILAAAAALDEGMLDAVEPLFSREFATIREGEVTLTDLWFAWHERRRAGVGPLDEATRLRVRRECPPPRRIDFRIIDEIV